MLAPVIYFSGNDGSGKSTASKKLAGRLVSLSASVSSRHYYDMPLRILVTKFVGSQKGTKSAVNHVTSTRLHFGRLSNWVFALLFFCYMVGMALSYFVMRLKSNDILVIDRSFVDDLVSVFTEKQRPIPVILIFSGYLLFPCRFLAFCYASQEVEYSRIASVDSSYEFHRDKSENYEFVLACLKKTRMKILKLSTGIK